MKEIIQKLKDKKIFKEQTLIEAEITKSFMGSPMKKQADAPNVELADDHCFADEEYAIEANVPMRKIMYDSIQIVDGMEPIELAAVYGLTPKTERFKRRKEQ